MLTLALSILVLTSAEEGATQPEAPPERAAVWVLPVGVAHSVLSPGDYFIPAGVNLPWETRHSVALELAFVRTQKGILASDSGGWRTGVVMAAGPSFQLTGQRRLHGLFVQPKVIAGLSRNDLTRATCMGEREFVLYSAIVHLGVDVGVHLRLGPLYVAPVIGASLGWSVNAMGGVYPGFSPNVDLTSGPSGSLNLTLLRVGAFF